MTDADASAAPEASEAPTATPPSRRSPWIRYAVSLATALALAAALAAIPRDECGASLSGACVDVGRDAFAERVGLGGAGTVDLGQITVHTVRAARAYGTSPDKEPKAAPAGGHWVVVDVSATVRDKPRRLTATLEEGGRSWQMEDDLLTGLPKLNPGIPSSGSLVFLVPDSVDTGDLVARLRFAEDPVVVVPLEPAETLPSVVLEKAS